MLSFRKLDMTTFEIIKELADKQGKSLQRVSEDLGLSQNYIYNLKGAKSPAADKLALIADYFDVSVDYLLGRSDKSRTSRPQNRIREFRRENKLSHSELAQKVNKWLEEEYNDFYETSNNKPIKFNAQKVLALENNELIIEPELSIPIWMAFSQVLGVDDRYLEGISDVKPLERKYKLSRHSDDLKKEFSINSLTNDPLTLKYLKRQDESYITKLTRSQFAIKEYIGEKNVEKLKNLYSVTETKLDGTTRTYMHDYFSLLDVLFTLQREFLEEDFQALLSFAQLQPKYKAKSLEQINNLLIVQETLDSASDKV